MRILWRVGLVLLTFAVIGYGTATLLIRRGVARGTPEYSVRMGGALGGLFVGGAAATIVTLALLLGKKGKSPSSDEDTV